MAQPASNPDTQRSGPGAKRSRTARVPSYPRKKPKVADDKAALHPESSRLVHPDRPHRISSAVGASSNASNYAAKAAARTHLRFDDNEEPSLGVQTERSLDVAVDSLHSQQNSEGEDAAESDDDAPEAISASAATKATKAAAAQIAQSVQQQKHHKRKKDQERDARLKTQAESSERRTLAKEAQDTARQEQIEEDQADDASKDGDMPDLLPEELLAEEFTRPPTPPPLEKLQKDGDYSRSRRIELKEKKIKVVKVGAINVSVLEKYNKLLAPKASTNSRGLREGWLAGQRTSAGKGAPQRKSFSTRFVAR